MARFDQKIYFGLAVTALALFIPIIVSTISLRELVTDQNALITQQTRELYLAELLRYEKERQYSLMPIYIMRGDPWILESFEQARSRFSGIVDELLNLSTDAKSKAMIVEIRDADRKLFDAGQPAIHMRKKGESFAKIDAYMSKISGVPSEKFNKVLDEFVGYKTNEFNRAKAATLKTTDNILRGFVVASLIAMIFAVLAVALMIRVVRQKRIDDHSKDLLLERETQLSQARKETVEIVSHDLKNPLSTAKMSVEMITDRLADANTGDPILENGLQITARSLKSMESLIGDLLDHAKIEAGQLVLERKPCNALVFLNDLFERFQTIARQKGVQLHLDLPHDVPALSCDQNRVEQVLSNLIGNAMKFSSSGKSIWIHVRVAGGFLLFSVRDQGPGIAENQLGHIFERYWQVRETARKGGNGLGLSIAKAIVKAHGGKIWAESIVGEGSEFYFSLPLEEQLSHPEAVGLH